MLTLWGEKFRYCDGVSRRTFLQAGMLAGVGGLAGGVTLPGLLRAESQQGKAKRHKSVIIVYLSGGLPHQDTFDLKPLAPKEIRGEFNPIDTVVPGIQISEMLPRLALVADRFSVVRSIVGLRDEHSSFQNLTGYSMGESAILGKPHIGSAISRVQGPVDPLVPPFMDLFPTMQHRPYNSPGPGNFGSAYQGIRADGEDIESMRLRYIQEAQFQKRRDLRAQLESLRTHMDPNAGEGIDPFYQSAYDVLASSKVVDALNLEKEDVRTREMYGKGSPQHLGDGAPLWNEQLLMARRLVEAGVRCVTVGYGFWDTHGNNFGHCRAHLPTFDQGIAGLIQDIYERGLDEDVSVVVWGEFGRGPRINKDAGRDHWPRVNCCLFSGGGMKTGQVIGSTDKNAEDAASRHVHYQDVLATIYHRLGIDPYEFVRDAENRPVGLLPESAVPITELI